MAGLLESQCVMNGSDVTLSDLAVRLTALRKRNAKIAITAHIRPDGDAIGSAVGLYHILKDQNFHVEIVDLGPIPDCYRFLMIDIDLKNADSCLPQDYDLLIVLDTGSIDRAPTFAQQWLDLTPTVNIDHHPTNTKFGTSNCVIPTASAVAEIITQFATVASWPISTAAATALWVGIVTDTGRFAYSSTSPATMLAAATLLENNVNTPQIDQDVFETASLGALRIQARAIEKMQLLQEQKLAVIPLSRQDFRFCEAQSEDAEEVINLPRRLHTVTVAIVITEMEESTPSAPRTKISFRTKPPFDAGTFCEALGGGGHARAAGCELPQNLANATDLIIQRVQEAWFCS